MLVKLILDIYSYHALLFWWRSLVSYSLTRERDSRDALLYMTWLLTPEGTLVFFCSWCWGDRVFQGCQMLFLLSYSGVNTQPLHLRHTPAHMVHSQSCRISVTLPVSHSQGFLMMNAFLWYNNLLFVVNDIQFQCWRLAIPSQRQTRLTSAQKFKLLGFFTTSNCLHSPFRRVQ